MRLRECGLELHPEKTRIVYWQGVNRMAATPRSSSPFSAYTFRPRNAVDEYGRVYPCRRNSGHSRYGCRAEGIRGSTAGYCGSVLSGFR